MPVGEVKVDEWRHYEPIPTLSHPCIALVHPIDGLGCLVGVVEEAVEAGPTGTELRAPHHLDVPAGAVGLLDVGDLEVVQPRDLPPRKLRELPRLVFIDVELGAGRAARRRTRRGGVVYHLPWMGAELMP